MDVGVLLVSRDTAFADERMTLRNRVIYHELKGLHSEDAYAFATRIMDTLKLDRAQAIYTEVCDLLAQLDYNPLAIQLVFPVLREYAPTKVQADFVALLTQFVDDMGAGRNRSLLISLDYSLRRLSEEHRVLLSRLVPFEGGASEDDLLAVTQISEIEWAELLPALEQAALLTVEQVHENIIVPFLHFHPVLVPYLRSQTSVEDSALYDRYIQRYSSLIFYLDDENLHNPLPVRALMQREPAQLAACARKATESRQTR